MPTHDKENRPYVRLSDLKAGDKVELDAEFTCVKAGNVTVFEDETGLYFTCRSGKHHLDGQCDEDSDHCVGVYHPR